MALNRRFTGSKCLINIGLRRQMRTGALQQREFDAADLCMLALFECLCQTRSQTTELRVAETVCCGGLRLGHERAVGIVEPSETAISTLFFCS